MISWLCKDQLIKIYAQGHEGAQLDCAPTHSRTLRSIYRQWHQNCSFLKSLSLSWIHSVYLLSSLTWHVLLFQRNFPTSLWRPPWLPVSDVVVVGQRRWHRRAGLKKNPVFFSLFSPTPLRNSESHLKVL